MSKSKVLDSLINSFLLKKKIDIICIAVAGIVLFFIVRYIFSSGIIAAILLFLSFNLFTYYAVVREKGKKTFIMRHLPISIGLIIGSFLVYLLDMFLRR